MREHKKLKRPQTPPASLDGIVTDGRRLGVTRHKAYQPNQGRPPSALNDSLNRVEGFHPLRSGAGASLGEAAGNVDKEVLLDEPIILDDETPKKVRGRHHRKGGSRLRKIIKRSMLVLLLLILIGGAYFGIKLYITQKNLFRGGGKSPGLSECNDINQLNREGDCRVNVLILGVGGPEHRGGDLSDTILIASVDPINHKAALLSVPRDLCMKPCRSNNDKINAVYALAKQGSRSKDLAAEQKAGIEAADSALESVLGVPIQYHVVVNFKAFQQTVDAIGGVDVNVPKELAVKERLWIEGTSKHYNLDVAAGQQHFDGIRALYFSRSRETSARGDFDRAERQRLILVAVKDKVLSAGTFSNPIKISSLLDSLGDNVYTDFERSHISRFYQLLSKVPSSNIKSLDLVTPPNDLLTTANLGGMSIVKPKIGLFDYSELQSYIRTNLRDGALAKENAQVSVYNATSTTGLAASEANELKSYGYSINSVGSTSTATNPSSTIVIDLSKGSKKYTKHYLEKRFGMISQTKLPAALGLSPPTGTHFVIILGKDVANRF